MQAVGFGGVRDGRQPARRPLRRPTGGRTGEELAARKVTVVPARPGSAIVESITLLSPVITERSRRQSTVRLPLEAGRLGRRTRSRVGSSDVTRTVRTRQLDREEVACRRGAVPVVVLHDDLEAAQRRCRSPGSGMLGKPSPAPMTSDSNGPGRSARSRREADSGRCRSRIPAPGRSCRRSRGSQTTSRAGCCPGRCRRAGCGAARVAD